LRRFLSGTAQRPAGVLSRHSRAAPSRSGHPKNLASVSIGGCTRLASGLPRPSAVHSLVARHEGQLPTTGGDDHARRDLQSGASARRVVPFETSARDGNHVEHTWLEDERPLFGGVTLPAAATALEYGCGHGRRLLRFAPRFARLDGLEASPGDAEVARRRCAAAGLPSRIWVTPPAALPDGVHGAYDLVYSFRDLDLANVANQSGATQRDLFDSVFQLLKPGGLLTLQIAWGGTAAAPTAEGPDGNAWWPVSLGSALRDVGFHHVACAVTPAASGERCVAWIAVRATKPRPDVRAETVPREWTP
jgi:SAM-dependent methyltransferase